MAATRSRSADPVEIALAQMQSRVTATDPVKWAYDKYGIELYSEQAEICHLVQEHPRVAVRSSHETGKTMSVAVLTTWWIDTHPIGSAYVVSTAPSAPQLKAVLWREINKLFELAKQRYDDEIIDAPLPGRLNQTEWWIGSRQVAMGRKPADWDTDAFQGIHDEYVLAIIEEANGVPKAMWTGVEGVTSNDTSRVIAVGNPDDPESEFARVSSDDNKIWTKKRISAFDTPAFTGEKVHPKLLRVLVGKNWVEARRQDWGEESTLYTSRVLGEFPDLATSRQKVVPVTAAMAALEEPDPDLVRRLRRTPVELGMDVAASEEGDWTVLRERRGAFVGRTWRVRTTDPEKAVDLAKEAAVESGATLIKVDEIGWGWGIVAAINIKMKHDKMRCRAVGVNVSKKAWHPDRFDNQRSELWWTVRDLLKDGGMVLHGYQEADAEGVSLVAQLTDPNWDSVTGGRIHVESKDETRKRIGRSPDDADALILAFARPTRSGGTATVGRAGAKQKRTVGSTPTRTTSVRNNRRRRGSLVARRG